MSLSRHGVRVVRLPMLEWGNLRHHNLLHRSFYRNVKEQDKASPFEPGEVHVLVSDEIVDKDPEWDGSTLPDLRCWIRV